MLQIWPEDKFPLQMVGKMVLDETAGNIFNEVEQIAFSPSMLVPGIGASDDKLLQSRLFAYADAQRYRLGINYLQLPINQPKNHYHNNHNDGAVQFNDKNEEVSTANQGSCCVVAQGAGAASGGTGRA